MIYNTVTAVYTMCDHVGFICHCTTLRIYVFITYRLGFIITSKEIFSSLRASIHIFGIDFAIIHSTISAFLANNIIESFY